MSLKKFVTNALCTCLALCLCFSATGCSLSKKKSDKTQESPAPTQAAVKDTTPTEEPQEEPTTAEEKQEEPDDSEQTATKPVQHASSTTKPSSVSKPAAEQDKPPAEQDKPPAEQDKPSEPTNGLITATSLAVGPYTLKDPDGVEYDTRVVLYTAYTAETAIAEGLKYGYEVLYTLGDKGKYRVSVMQFDTKDNADVFAAMVNGIPGISQEGNFIIVRQDENSFPQDMSASDYIQRIKDSGMKEIIYVVKTSDEQLITATSLTVGPYTLKDPDGVEYDTRVVLYTAYTAETAIAEGLKYGYEVLYTLGDKGKYRVSVMQFDTKDNADVFAAMVNGIPGISQDGNFIIVRQDENSFPQDMSASDYIQRIKDSGMKEIIYVAKTSDEQLITATSLAVGSYTLKDPDGVEYDTRVVLYTAYTAETAIAEGLKYGYEVLYTLGDKGKYRVSVMQFDTKDNADVFAAMVNGIPGISQDENFIIVRQDENSFPQDMSASDYIQRIKDSGMKEIIYVVKTSDEQLITTTSLTVGPYTLKDPDGVEYDTRVVLYTAYTAETAIAEGLKYGYEVLYTLGDKCKYRVSVMQFDTKDNADVFAAMVNGVPGISQDGNFIIVRQDENSFPQDMSASDYIQRIKDSGMKEITYVVK